MNTTQIAALSGESWKNAAENLNMLSEKLCSTLIKAAQLCDVSESELQECCEDFAGLVFLAMNAMLYVSEFAADKVQVAIAD